LDVGLSLKNYGHFGNCVSLKPKFWENVFEESDYKEEQKKDIAAAFSKFF
jgi:hypothetical protein